MADEKQRNSISKCGWCLTNRCNECVQSGDGWECHCDHKKPKKSKKPKE